MRLLGVSDPRSSGLGTWRDERGISFEDQEQRIADVACRHDADGDRIATLLVHDANSGRRRSTAAASTWCWPATCTSRSGPTAVTGANGKVGYSYTNGTTGGAAYALAIGSKLRRDAEVTLVTYRDGAPGRAAAGHGRHLGDVPRSATVHRLRPDRPAPADGSAADAGGTRPCTAPARAREAARSRGRRDAGGGGGI